MRPHHAALAVLLIACSDDPTPPDTRTTDATAADSEVSDGCDHEGFPAAVQRLTLGADEVPRYQAFSTAGTPYDQLAFEFFAPADHSAPHHPVVDGPGVFAIGATLADQNYQSCSTCVLIRQGCDGTGTCERYFFATGGSIDVTEVDIAGRIVAGTATDLTLSEVTIADDFTSTEVVSGQSWCIDALTFATTPECTSDDDCDAPGKGVCDLDTLTCVGCETSFDCAPATPVCALNADATTCVASLDECADDDDAEPNDAPSEATALTPGTSFAGKACTGKSAAESDWFTFTTTATQSLRATLTWTTTGAHFFVSIYDRHGALVGVLGQSGALVDEVLVPFADQGIYYVEVQPIDTTTVDGGDSAVAYTLDVTTTTPECSATTTSQCVAPEVCDTDLGVCVVCRSAFDCHDVAAPACLVDARGEARCGDVALCSGDDADSDDGPAAATIVGIPTNVTGTICGADGAPSGAERDWYRLQLDATADLELALAWTGTSDLDFAVFDADGHVVLSAATQDKNPETIALPALAAGDYFVSILSYAATNATAATSYTLTIDEP